MIPKTFEEFQQEIRRVVAEQKKIVQRAKARRTIKGLVLEGEVEEIPRSSDQD